MLQGLDIHSFLPCLLFHNPALCLTPSPPREGGYQPIQVPTTAARHFILDPYPFPETSLTFHFPARHIKGKIFSSSAELQSAIAAAPKETLSVTVSAS